MAAAFLEGVFVSPLGLPPCTGGSREKLSPGSGPLSRVPHARALRVLALPKGVDWLKYPPGHFSLSFSLPLLKIKNSFHRIWLRDSGCCMHGKLQP